MLFCSTYPRVPGSGTLSQSTGIAPIASYQQLGASMSDHVPDLKVVLAAVADSLGEVVARDRELLELHAHELALVHRFAVYLESRLEPDLRRSRLTIDLDYDRQRDLRKLLPPRPGWRESDPPRFRPDLIVHRRRTSTHDILVVEWKKKASAQVLGCLEERVRSLLASDDPHRSYKYQLGVLVNSDDNGIRWRSVDSGGPTDDWQNIGG
jgi:hypothetical protein